MRTTVTLDPVAEQLVRRRMQEHGISFKQAVNDLIRAGAVGPSPSFETRVVAMGRPQVNLDRALQLAEEIEDEEILRKMQRGL
jgi:hypothetical protein